MRLRLSSGRFRGPGREVQTSSILKARKYSPLKATHPSLHRWRSVGGIQQPVAEAVDEGHKGGLVQVAADAGAGWIVLVQAANFPSYLLADFVNGVEGGRGASLLRFHVRVAGQLHQFHLMTRSRFE